MCDCDNIVALKLPSNRFKNYLLSNDTYLHICAITYAENQNLSYYDIVKNCVFCEEYCYIIFKAEYNANKNKTNNTLSKTKRLKNSEVNRKNRIT